MSEGVAGSEAMGEGGGGGVDSDSSWEHPKDF